MKDLMPKVMKFVGAVAVIVVAFYVYDWIRAKREEKMLASSVEPVVEVTE